MTEGKNKDKKDLSVRIAEESGGEEFDAAGKSLSEALRISFIVLKVIMVVLVIAFLASGFKTIGSDKEALVLQFGKIRGVGEDRILEPRSRPYWILPYPIHKMVKIPVKKKINLAINSFWYFQTKREMLAEGPKRPTRVPKTLNPIDDGYCITRSEKRDELVAGSDGSDYNIVHCKWQVTYQIDDPELFFKNVYVDDIKPGDIYFDVMTESIRPLLQTLVEDAVVTALVSYTVDDVLSGRSTITDRVEKLLRDKLRQVESGIEVDSVLLTQKEPPRQVYDAFQAAHSASQKRQDAVIEARTYEQTILIRAEAQAQEIIAKAQAYKTEVIASASANAKYLQQLLPEYRKHPRLVVQKIYKDAIESVLNNADEKFVLPEGKELRFQVSRDPLLKRKSGKEETTQED